MLECCITIGFRATPTPNCIGSVYRARYYDPIRGRFVGEDPIGLLGGDLNLYAYVGGTPVTHTDPFGLYFFHVHGPVTFIAMVSKGYDPVTSAFTAGTNIGADFVQGSLDPANANKHGMAQPNQSPADARRGADEFIQTKIVEHNLVALGAALHASDDKYARGHQLQEWTGEYTKQHLWGDLFPTPTELLNAIKDQRDIISRHQKQRLGGRK